MTTRMMTFRSSGFRDQAAKKHEEDKEDQNLLLDELLLEDELEDCETRSRISLTRSPTTGKISQCGTD
jgi:hypothetical protein